MSEVVVGWTDKVFDFAQLDLLIISLLIGIFAVALLRVQRQVRIECRRREESDRQLHNALQRITHLEDHSTTTPSPAPTFDHDLNQAELKNRLQSPAPSGNTPDKYRHVASLAAQGMSVDQIAEVLNISLPEANQLVTLSRLAQR
ncbi:MAG: hypothetical protein U9R29_09150 [Thermodesulfobacteriota bacterium]|nr:hypothetical protein [Thermodesulfobacteriota bacterium]